MTISAEARVETLLNEIVRGIVDWDLDRSVTHYDGHGELWQKVRCDALVHDWNNRADTLPAWRFLWDHFDSLGDPSHEAGTGHLIAPTQDLATYIYRKAYADGHLMGSLETQP